MASGEPRFREVGRLRATPTGLWMMLGGMVGALYSLLSMDQWQWAAFTAAALAVLVGGFFTIEAMVSDSAVVVRMGLGPVPLWRRTVPATEVIDVDVVPADAVGQLFAGWGGSRRGVAGAIVESAEGPSSRLTGWCAVRIRLTNGSMMRFGCWRWRSAIEAIERARDGSN